MRSSGFIFKLDSIMPATRRNVETSLEKLEQLAGKAYPGGEKRTQSAATLVPLSNASRTEPEQVDTSYGFQLRYAEKGRP